MREKLPALILGGVLLLVMMIWGEMGLGSGTVTFFKEQVSRRVELNDWHVVRPAHINDWDGSISFFRFEGIAGEGIDVAHSLGYPGRKAQELALLFSDWDSNPRGSAYVLVSLYYSEQREAQIQIFSFSELANLSQECPGDSAVLCTKLSVLLNQDYHLDRISIEVVGQDLYLRLEEAYLTLA